MQHRSESAVCKAMPERHGYSLHALRQNTATGATNVRTEILMKRRTWVFVLLGSLASFLGLTQAAEITATGSLVPVGEALACFSPGNCINSLDDLGSLPPLRFSGTAAEGKAVLLATLAAFPEATVHLDEPLQIEAIFTTPVGFRDTVLFRIDAAGQRIDFRSSSNFGLYDFGKNRSRMKEFTARFEKTLASLQGR